MKRLIVLCLTFLFIGAYAAPLNSNGDIVTVTFEDSATLVFSCQQKASGSVALLFKTPTGDTYPYVVTCGVSS